jgi:hypothetical protein
MENGQFQKRAGKQIRVPAKGLQSACRRLGGGSQVRCDLFLKVIWFKIGKIPRVSDIVSNTHKDLKWQSIFSLIITSIIGLPFNRWETKIITYIFAYEGVTFGVSVSHKTYIIVLVKNLKKHD